MGAYLGIFFFFFFFLDFYLLVLISVTFQIILNTLDDIRSSILSTVLII